MYPGARVSAPHSPLGAAAALLLAACAVYPSEPPPAPPLPGPAGPVRPPGEPTRLLTAHAQAPGPAQRDFHGAPVAQVVHLVFSRPLDPSGLVPERFVVLAEDGSRRPPLAARLGPASERDELRSVELLVGAPERRLLSVTLVGKLHDAEGRELDGLSVDVAPAGAAVAPVAAERLSPGTSCPGAAQAVRVWWSAPVVAAEGAVRLVLGDGRALAPEGRDDLACPPGVRLAEGGPACDIGDDNVIDYCALAAGAALRVELDPGAARGLAGEPSAPGQLELSSGR